MNINKIKDAALALVIGSLCFMGVLWYLSDVKSEKVTSTSAVISNKKESSMLKLLPSMSGITKENINEMLGEPKEVYKNKIYTYVDKYAQYDFLMEDSIKSAVVTMKDTIYISQLDSLLNILVPEYDKSKVKDYERDSVKGHSIIKIYKLGGYSKIEIATKEASDIIEYIKVKY